MQVRGSREVYANAWMTVREDAITHAGGDGIYGVVEKPDFALVIAREGGGDGGRLMMVEQYRHPLGMRRWEFPQGTAPDRRDVPPRELAAAELREETGLSAASWEYLGLLDVAPGLSSQRGRVFLATDLAQGETAREPSEADMRCAWITPSDFEAMVRAEEVTDAQSIAAYTLLGLASAARRGPRDGPLER